MRFLPDRVVNRVARALEEPDLTDTRYRLVGPLGRGGMGSVYEVEDVELQRRVALKACRAVSSADLSAERLRREARILARLEHPGIVAVHEVGVLTDGRVYYAMKLVRGQRLDEWARSRPGRPQRLRLFQRICEAVAFAHAHGVVHRDLKPQNIMVGEFGEALVMDWGIAKELARASEQSDPSAQTASSAHNDESGAGTRTGTVLGTPGYMPPEQALGLANAVDARADVYALGAVLRFLVGEPMPRPLASICAKATAEEPIQRYASATDLLKDVGNFLDENAVSAHSEAPWEVALRFVGRHRTLVALLAAYLITRLLLATL